MNDKPNGYFDDDFDAKGDAILNGTLSVRAAKARSNKTAIIVASILGAVAVVLAAVVMVVFLGVGGYILTFFGGGGVFGAEEPYVPAFGAEDPEAARLYEEARVLMMEQVVKIDVIYNNIFINGIDVSGLSKEAALEKAAAELAYIYDLEITVPFMDTEHILKFNEFGAGYDVEAAVERAYAFGRSGSLIERFAVVMGLNDNGYHVEAVFGFDEDLVAAAVEKFSEIYDEANKPVEPHMEFVGGVFNITEQQDGFEIDTETMIYAISAQLNARESGTVEMAVILLEPKYSSVEFARANSLIGTFTTHFSANDQNRNENIRLAGEKINGIVVLPGEVFSTNDAFGAVTAATGWRLAAGFSQGRVVQSIGGGMCQVSTTLYVALLYAELEIVQRRNHSMPVGYVPMAFDATLVTGAIDLRFRNDTEHPVTIEAIKTPTSVTVNIYGFESRDPARSIRFDSIRTGTHPAPATVYTEDPTLPYGQRVEVVRSRTGFDYRMRKHIYMDGQHVETVTVNNSHYRAFQGQVRVGTANRPEAPPPGTDYTPADAPPNVYGYVPPSGYEPSGYEPISGYDTGGYYTTDEPTPAYDVFQPEVQPENYEFVLELF